MPEFRIGIAQITVALALCLAYLVRLFFNKSAAHLKGREQPKDKVLKILVLTAVAGLVLGGFLQPSWNSISYCTSNNIPLIKCLISNN